MFSSTTSALLSMLLPAWHALVLVTAPAVPVDCSRSFESVSVAQCDASSGHDRALFDGNVGHHPVDHRGLPLAAQAVGEFEQPEEFEEKNSEDKSAESLHAPRDVLAAEGGSTVCDGLALRWRCVVTQLSRGPPAA